MVLICSIILFLTGATDVLADPHVYLNRTSRQAFIGESKESLRPLGPIGIGRGGLSTKKTMGDLITPTGHFVVDLILYRDSLFNAIDSKTAERFRDRMTLGTTQSLAHLFETMNGIDFDGNGKPDGAYGDGYIGLASSDAVTGPKLTQYRGGPLYWFSIAMHGTPNQENIGQAQSGGCVHLPAALLRTLITGREISIGTPVTIED